MEISRDRELFRFQEIHNFIDLIYFVLQNLLSLKSVVDARVDVGLNDGRERVPLVCGEPERVGNDHVEDAEQTGDGLNDIPGECDVGSVLRRENLRHQKRKYKLNSSAPLEFEELLDLLLLGLDFFSLGLDQSQQEIYLVQLLRAPQRFLEQNLPRDQLDLG